MTLNLTEFQGACSIIKTGISKGLTIENNAIQLKSEDNKIVLMFSTNEYTIKTTIANPTNDTINATVSADKFVELISKLGAETIDFTQTDCTLVIKTSKTKCTLPLLLDDYGGTNMKDVRDIVVRNPQYSFKMSLADLRNIYNINMKELDKGSTAQDVQTYCYIDEIGAITFTSGACINSFSNAGSPKFIINKRMMQMLLVFRDDVDANIESKNIAENIITTTLKMTDGTTTITYALEQNIEDKINKIPVASIRSLANSQSLYELEVTRSEILSSIDRLLIFKDDPKRFSVKISLHTDHIEISATGMTELVDITSPISNLTSDYETYINASDLRKTLSSYDSEKVVIKIVDRAFILNDNNICNIIPKSAARA